ncbi:replication initiation protein (plasmid) [Pontibacillus sp. ALD_SL1]|uniref:replication initiation protein n=1 Tax=Pontibacillus sp. ALD_SL1 TaxID=2777185 RepID=UPI001A97A335|nr:replication initiation protein [Pontibacillus sp. ALD_SL1]QST02019.1 replication initiation protein [Pontibacillus sp. ALD_SL1]
MSGSNLIAQKQEENVVTKLNALVEANYHLTTTEQKIVLFLVSEIRKDDQDFKTYKLPIKLFCELIGQTGTPKYSELRAITKNLMSKILEIKDGQKTKQMGWISYVEYDHNEGTILMSFDPRLKPYLIQLKREFTSYKLKNILALKRGSSIRIYELLKKWDRIGEMTVNLSDFRKQLGLQDKYKEFHNLRKRVLNPAKEELKQKTDISFTYETIKSGRKVSGIRFQLVRTSNARIETLPSGDECGEPNEDELHRSMNSLLSSSGDQLTEATFKKLVAWSEYIWDDNPRHNLYVTFHSLIQQPNVTTPIGLLIHKLKEYYGLKEAGHAVDAATSDHAPVPGWFLEQKKDPPSDEPASPKTQEEIEREKRELKKELENMVE